MIESEPCATLCKAPATESAVSGRFTKQGGAPKSHLRLQLLRSRPLAVLSAAILLLSSAAAERKAVQQSDTAARHLLLRSLHATVEEKAETGAGGWEDFETRFLASHLPSLALLLHKALPLALMAAVGQCATAVCLRAAVWRYG